MPPNEKPFTPHDHYIEATKALRALMGTVEEGGGGPEAGAFLLQLAQVHAQMGMLLLEIEGDHHHEH